MLELVWDSIPNDTQRLIILPEWIRPAEALGYWHQPRSAWIREDAGRVHLSTFCGQLRNQLLGELTDRPPDPVTQLICGTCVGRRMGRDNDGVIFRPRDIRQPPRRCPGRDWLHTVQHHRLDGAHPCEACGLFVRWGNCWPYGGSSGTVQHAPGPNFVRRWERCYWHGWTRPWMHEGRLWCGHFGCPNAHQVGRF